MTDDGAAKEAELLEVIEAEWAKADRARSRVVRPARRGFSCSADEPQLTVPICTHDTTTGPAGDAGLERLA